MLGRGCPWQDVCGICKRESTAWKKARCWNDHYWQNCSHKPGNSGNKELQKKDANFRRNQSDAGLGWLLIIGVIAMVVISKFL